MQKMSTTLASCLAVAAFAGSASAQRFLIDFGPATRGGNDALTASPDANNNSWNNFGPGGNIKLMDTTGALSASTSPLGIALFAETGVATNTSQDNGGLDNPDPAFLGNLAIPSATGDYVFLPEGDGFLSFTLDAISPANTYTFRFFGSRRLGDTSANRETLYEVYADFPTDLQSASLVTSGGNIGSDGMYDGNDNMIAEITGVQPNATAQVYIDISSIAGSGFHYINALEIIVEGGVEVAVSQQPEGDVVDAGGTLSFTAAGTTTGAALTYQWRLDGNPLADDGRITGATTATLSVANASLDDVGEYTCVLSDSGASAITASAVGGVRETLLGAEDFNNDGSANFFDVLDFLGVFEAAQ